MIDRVYPMILLDYCQWFRSWVLLRMQMPQLHFSFLKFNPVHSLYLPFILFWASLVSIYMQNDVSSSLIRRHMPSCIAPIKHITNNIADRVSYMPHMAINVQRLQFFFLNECSHQLAVALHSTAHWLSTRWLPICHATSCLNHLPVEQLKWIALKSLSISNQQMWEI